MKTSIIKRNNAGIGSPAMGVSSWVDHLLQNSLSNFFNDENWGFNSINYESNIPVNLRETEKTFEMELVAPGLRKEDFGLQVSNDLLTVSFEKKEEQSNENKTEGWLRNEFKLASFSRSFRLDDSIDVSKITAAYNNGILQLTLPKKEHAQKLSRTIEII
ncbi:MAG TPA: Hsp20/alpha crystallin family protein [Chitinophagaceae bacterium]|nr:Hsp20/alpha crystallin family protein [Chitinophagaceae bacterium]